MPSTTKPSGGATIFPPFFSRLRAFSGAANPKIDFFVLVSNTATLTSSGSGDAISRSRIPSVNQPPCVGEPMNTRSRSCQISRLYFTSGQPHLGAGRLANRLRYLLCVPII